jgi:hypothetical protein
MAIIARPAEQRAADLARLRTATEESRQQQKPPPRKGRTMTNPNLKLEVRDQADGTVRLGGPGGTVIALPPSLGEDYWAYRVMLGDRQAIVGFPKFFTVGIGFAVEDDWNTNFPYTCETGEIFAHVAHNKGDDSIADGDVREAIRMVQAAAREARDGE